MKKKIGIVTGCFLLVALGVFCIGTLLYSVNSDFKTWIDTDVIKNEQVENTSPEDGTETPENGTETPEDGTETPENPTDDENEVQTLVFSLSFEV